MEYRAPRLEIRCARERRAHHIVWRSATFLHMIVRTIAFRRIGMAVYNVVTGQGITVKNLGANMLITGIGDGADAVQSCSVVMFFNTKSCAAGLFHFPAGNVRKELGSKTALTAMSKAVGPNDCYIAYGVTNLVSV